MLIAIEPVYSGHGSTGFTCVIGLVPLMKAKTCDIVLKSLGFYNVCGTGPITSGKGDTISLMLDKIKVTSHDG